MQALTVEPLLQASRLLGLSRCQQWTSEDVM